MKIAQGAEAILYKDNNTVIKERISKSYRLPQIDESLRKFRTRREAKVLRKLEEMQFPSPALIDFCDKRMSITMDFIPGEKLRDVLLNSENHIDIAKQIGERVSKLHEHDIIHGDLTTSNMIMSNQVKFIDFGLSFFSDKVEDKAVDLFLMERAMADDKISKQIISSYKESNPDSAKVLDRLEIVKKRGRNK